MGTELGAHSTDFRKKVPHFEHTGKADKKSPERNGIVLKLSLIETVCDTNMLSGSMYM